MKTDMNRPSGYWNPLFIFLKKVGAIPTGTAQNFFQCKPCLFAEGSIRSHAGKTIVSLMQPNYNCNTITNSS